MILSILSILSNAVTLYSLDHVTQLDPHTDHQHAQGTLHALVRLDYQQSHMIAKDAQFTGDYSHLDPKAPLSNKDLGILLLDHCNTKAVAERDLTDAKLENAIKGLCNQIVILRHELQKQMSDLQMKLAKLESSSSPDLPSHNNH